VREAVLLLTAFCQREDHVFWEDTVTLRDSAAVSISSVQGHRQLTDVYLLSLAVSRDAALATFDRSIPTAAVPRAEERHLVLVGD
jgi:hypothetical protein